MAGKRILGVSNNGWSKGGDNGGSRLDIRRQKK